MEKIGEKWRKLEKNRDNPKKGEIEKTRPIPKHQKHRKKKIEKRKNRKKLGQFQNTENTEKKN